MSKERKYELLVAHPFAGHFDGWAAHIKTSSWSNVSTCSAGRGLLDALARKAYDVVVIGDVVEDLDWHRLVRLLRSGRFCSPTILIIMVITARLGAGASAIAKNHHVIPVLVDGLSNLRSVVVEGAGKAPKPDLLIVEDDVEIANLLTRSLECEFCIRTAQNGESAFRCWQQGNFDLVLLDLMLPDMSGESILKHIVSEKPDQLVAIITAHGTAERHRLLIEGGAIEFVDKPFDINALRALCLQIISERAHAEADRATG